MPTAHVALLGATQISVDGVPVTVSARRPRTLLSLLALHRGRAVDRDQIADELWAGAPPPGARNTVQGYVAALRRAIEPGRGGRGAPSILVTRGSGYALEIDEAGLDLAAFESGVRRALGALPSTADPVGLLSGVPAGGLDDELSALEDVLALWRGDPLPDLGDSLLALRERDRLRALHLEATVLRLGAAVALGRGAAALPELEPLAGAHPWDERVWGLWAVALAHAGRTAEALARLRSLRSALVAEHGLDPGRPILELEGALLRRTDLPPPAAPVVVDETPCLADRWRLVGRDHELGVLAALLDEVRSGRPQVVHVTGEQGAGKSRLVRELRRTARQLDVDTEITGAATASGRLRALGRQPDAFRRPLVLAVEDAQQADRVALEDLGECVERLSLTEGALPVLLVITQQTPMPGGLEGRRRLLVRLARAHATEIRLGGLGPAAAGELLRDVCGFDVHPHLVHSLHARADGNPFVLVELARAQFLDNGLVPETVRTVVADRLSCLPEATRDLLAGAALIDRVFDADLLAHAAGAEVDDVHDTLQPAVVVGVLDEEPDSRYRFCSAIVAEVLAGGLPARVRASWHVRVAEVLDTLTALDRPDRRRELVRHWTLAGYPYGGSAWRSGLRAVRAAEADGELDEALTLLESVEAGLRIDPDAMPADRAALDGLRAALERRADGAASSIRTG